MTVVDRDEWVHEAVEWCWLVTATGARLHHGAFTGGEPGDPHGPGRTDCGLDTVLSVPGIFTRMGAVRCRRCCAATGMPDGTGSPKNDPVCRAVVVDRLGR